MRRLGSCRICLIPLLFLLLFRLSFAAADYQIEVFADELECRADLPANIVNILLIGTDTWDDLPNSGRSDTMIVCSFNKDTGEVRLLSIARDLMVNIPKDGGWNRLNAAHSFGGPYLLMKTLNRTLHLNIARYVSLNIYGLRRIIDGMGGLSVSVTQDEAREINRMIGIEFPNEENPPCGSGEVFLSGLQAMTYARIRDLDSDFGRMARQRRVILSMASQAMQMDEEAQEAFLRACVRNCSTNINMADILEYSAAAILHGIGSISMQTLPRPGTFLFDRYKGMSVMLAEEDALAYDARSFLYDR